MTDNKSENKIDGHDKSEVAKEEEKILEFWRANKIFEKSVERPASAEPTGEYIFYDGPPFATGLPHFGHLLPTSLKDAIPRYQTMKGNRVRRRFGWDCHGLPVENIVEAELNLRTKKDIEEYGIARFNEAARRSVLRYTHKWEKIIPRMGRWVDMADDYRTMDATYTESVWWVFKTLFDRGLVYEGYKSMHLCPRCETTLANFEVNQGYQDITDLAVTVKFKIKDPEKAGLAGEVYLLAWTTTPWTLPGNAALAVNEKIVYGQFKIKNLKISPNRPAVETQTKTGRPSGETVILAADKAESVLKNYNYELIGKFNGKRLAGLEYEPLFDYYVADSNLENRERGWQVYLADFVTTEEGTGIVHVAPAFGEDDMALGKKYNLPFIQHVGMNGRFKPEVTDWVGMPVKPKDSHQTTDIEIIKKLAHDGKLLAKEKITHSYPHCWRCDTPLLNYAANSWFVKVTAIKDRLLAANQSINWVPAHIKNGRFGKWLLGARDWAISRSRFWGAPIPVWRCNQCGKLKIIGSISELSKQLPPPANRYFLMRHGEAESNVLNIVSGQADVPHHLTAAGRSEIKAAAKKLTGQKIDLIFTSPFVRTRETASIIAAATRFSGEVIVDERLKEINAGEFNNQPIEEYRGYFKNTLDKFSKRPPAGETLNDVRNRMTDFIKEVEKKYSGQTILIISHEYPLWMLDASLRGLTDREAAKIKDQSEDYIKTGEVREAVFTRLPRNSRLELDLHRPYIDKCQWSCACGGVYHRVPEVFDCWFESGAMPYGSAHYPFAQDNNFEPKKNIGWPADFIAEALDQTRGWFYSLLVLTVALFDQPAYKNVIVNGLILAADGQKMSKRLKNYPDLETTINKYGADALRLFLLGSPAAGAAEDFNFSESALAEVYRRIILRLLNVLAFYELFAVGHLIKRQPLAGREIIDQWILARLAETDKQISRAMKDYRIDRAVRPISDFVDDLSTWYIRRSRDRFKSDNQDKRQSARETTGYVLFNFARILAPLAPFTAEIIYQKLNLENKKTSVHLEPWPEPTAVNEKVLTEMKQTRSYVELALAARAEAGIKVRQPLQTLVIKDGSFSASPGLLDLIKEEVNIREIKINQSLTKTLELDTEINDELKAAGLVRDLIRQLQELRKDLNLLPHDRINLFLMTDDSGRTLVVNNEEIIKKTAGLDKLSFIPLTAGKTVLVGNLKFKIKAEKTAG